jgi:dTDP-glucose 4,6-dehydratase
MSKKRQFNNILVTGGAGFIGSAFIRYLLQKENFSGNIYNLDLLTYAGNLQNTATISEDPRYFFIRGDICDYELVSTLCQQNDIDAIFHFAAESHVDNSIKTPKSFIETNVLGTFHLLEVVRAMPHIHFHHISTDEVYGSLSYDGTFTEESIYRPSSPYSASKAASDHFVRSYGATYGIPYTLSNCSNNYGPYQHPEKLIPRMILRCLEGETLPIYGNGENIRDWLYVEDHAEAIYLIAQQGRLGETYNVGGECEISNLDIIDKIIMSLSKNTGEAEAHLHALKRFVEDRPGHDFRYSIDCSKLKSELGWSPRHTIETGLEYTVQWYIEAHKQQYLQLV